MIVLLLILVVLLASTTILGVLGTRYFFLDRSALRLQPTNIHTFAAANRDLEKTDRPRLVLFGDSRATQLPVGALRDRFQIVNRAISGESVAQMVYRFRQDVLDLDPDVVVIFAGINDLTAAAALPDRREATVESVAGALKRFAEEAQAAGATVVLLTIVRPTDPRPVRWLIWNDSIYALVQRVNEKLRRLQGPRLVLLDADALLVGGANRLPRHLATDEVHLAPEGNQRLLHELKRLLPAERRREDATTPRSLD